jgi:hypothetical protein
MPNLSLTPSPEFVGTVRYWILVFANIKNARSLEGAGAFFALSLSALARTFQIG